MKAQIFLWWVKMLSFIHSPFSEPTVLGSDETYLNKTIGHHLLLEPHRCAEATSTDKGRQRAEVSTHLAAPAEDWKASLSTVCIQVYCILYTSILCILIPTVFVHIPGGLVELLLLLWALLSGFLLQASYCFPLYYSLLLVLCVVHVLSRPQKCNYYSYFLNYLSIIFQDFVLRKENSICTCFSY